MICSTRPLYSLSAVPAVFVEETYALAESVKLVTGGVCYGTRDDSQRGNDPVGRVIGKRSMLRAYPTVGVLCWLVAFIVVPVARFRPAFLVDRIILPPMDREMPGSVKPEPKAGDCTNGWIRPISSRSIVKLVAWLTPWPARWCTCLAVSVTVASALRLRWSLHPVVRMGARQRDGQLQMHAWVELDGRPLTATSDSWSVFTRPFPPPAISTGD